MSATSRPRPSLLERLLLLCLALGLGLSGAAHVGLHGHGGHGHGGHGLQHGADPAGKARATSACGAIAERRLAAAAVEPHQDGEDRTQGPALPHGDDACALCVLALATPPAPVTAPRVVRRLLGTPVAVVATRPLAGSREARVPRGPPLAVRPSGC